MHYSLSYVLAAILATQAVAQIEPRQTVSAECNYDPQCGDNNIGADCQITCVYSVCITYPCVEIIYSPVAC